MTQVAEFYAAVLQSLPELSPAEMQEWIGPSRSTLRSGLLFLSLDIVRVDHSVRPSYPNWADQAYINTDEFMALQQTGPSEYSLGSLQLLLHPLQCWGRVVTGHDIYKYQKELGLQGCLGLADHLAIQKLGLAAFRRHFKDKIIPAWKSVVPTARGSLRVPCLIEYGGQVKLFWNWFSDDWDAVRPALRFTKKHLA